MVLVLMFMYSVNHALGKMQFNLQGVTHNPVPQIENIDSRIFLRYPAYNSGNSK